MSLPGKAKITRRSSPSLREEHERQDDLWFRDRFNAAQQILDFLGAVGISAEGRKVADIGCGDGAMALGMMHLGKPAQLSAFDLNPVSPAALARAAAGRGVPSQVPEALQFKVSEISTIPAPDDEFDIVYTWSVFEHASDPVGLLGEIRRILKPDGVLMLQLWPFFHSEHGSHLMDWFDYPFVQLRHEPSYIEKTVRANTRFNQQWGQRMLEEFSQLNRITLDDLQRAILVAGLRIRRLELLTNAVDIPPELDMLSPDLLGISGVKLLAVQNRP